MADPIPSRKRSTLANLWLQVLNVALLVIQSVALVPFYLRHIPRDTYGAWIASGSTIAWLSIIDPGFSVVMQQRVGAAVGAGDHGGAGKAAGTGLALMSGIAVVFGLGCILVAPWVPRLVKLPGEVAGREISESFACAGLAQALFMVAAAASVVVMASLTRYLAAGLAYLLAMIVGVGTTIGMMLHGVGIIAIPFGLLVRNALLLVLNGLLLVDVLRRLRVSATLSLDELQKMTRLSSYTWFSRMMVTLAGQFDSFLIARWFGPGAVPQYTFTKRAADLLSQIATRFSMAFAPALTHVSGGNQPQLLRDASLRMLRVAIWGGSACLGVFIGLNRSFVGLWVGADYYGGATLTVLVAVSIFLQMVGGAIATVVTATGRFREISNYTSAEACLRSLASAASIALIGRALGIPLGAAIATGVLLPLLLVPLLAKAVGSDLQSVAGVVGRLTTDAGVAGVVGLVWLRFVPATGSVVTFVASGALLGGLILSAQAVLSSELRREIVLLVHWLKARMRTLHPPAAS
jgi:O-antigen/teichoic acid export membrane protein